MRILVSVLLLAPPAFCMGMMFPLGLSIWRRKAELLPFFWSANGITSMFASAGHGLVDRIRNRQNIRAGRMLLCRLCSNDRR